MWVFDRLTVRIFTVFLLTMGFFLTLMLAFPTFDSRNLSYLSNNEKDTSTILAQNIEVELNKIPQKSFRWWMRFIVVMDTISRSDQSLFIITPNDQIITPASSYLEIVREFNEQSHNIDAPAKKIYGAEEILGPFQINYNNEIYLLYILQPAIDMQSQFVSMLFDHPLMLLLIMMLVSSPLLLWLSWSLARPARRLKKAADEVARGNLQEWPELESGSSEYKATGASFNQMLRELQRMQDLQQRLFSDISHELRTPLTRLKLATALLRRKKGENNELARIEDESNKLDMMIGELLLLARQQYDNNEVRVLLKAEQLWKSVLYNAKFEAEQINKTFTIIHQPPHVTILGYQSSLCSALENVIRNAFRYSYRQIEVDFKTKDHKLTISVDDDGPGVADAQLEQIFRPFYRTSEARDRATGGTGLGLAIVHNAIKQDKGMIIAEKSHLGGLRVVISLPIYNDK